MILDVPFFKQEQKNDCGPSALQMVLDYLGEYYPKEKLMDLVDSDRSGVTFTLGLARAVAELGFKTEFYSANLGINPENYNLEFYKKETEGISLNQEKLNKLISESKKLGVKIEERKLSLEELLSKLSEDCIPIILLDWSLINETENFIGHFVPIVGYDEENVYVHNQGLKDFRPFLPIKRKLFDQARTAKGTDEDVLFVYRRY